MLKVRVLLGTVCAACLCLAQQSHVFPGTNIPLTIAPKELKATFFPMKIKEQSSGALGDYYSQYSLQFLTSFRSGSNTSQAALNELFELLPVSWTKNETATLYGETFLVTYIWEPSIEDISSFAEGKAMKPIDLKLKLVKANQIGTIEPFPGMTTESYIAALTRFQSHGNRQVAPAGAQTESLSRIKQYSLAVMLYLSDYDDIYPYVQGSRQLKEVVMPYIKSEAISQTLNPNRPGMFLFNMALGGVNSSEVPDVVQTPLLFDPTPWPDGRYVVSYADGHAKIIGADAWKDLQKYFKLKLKKSAKPLKP